MIHLTVSEYLALTQEKKEFLYGIQGIADALGICKTKAFYLKKSGAIDKALHIIGKKIRVDVKLVRELYIKNREIYKEFIKLTNDDKAIKKQIG